MSRLRDRVILERDVELAVLDAARCYGITLERSNVAECEQRGSLGSRRGVAGDTDWRCPAIACGPNRGRSLNVEVKRSNFDPRTISGIRKKDHWARQLARMRALNEAGALAFWVRDAKDAAWAFRRIVCARVDVFIDDKGFCFLDDGVNS